MKQIFKIFTFLTFLIIAKPTNAQLGLEVNWTMFLSYDSVTNTYNVYGISDTSSSGPFGWAIASSQITVLIPDSLPNVPLAITSVQFGGWSDVVDNYNCPSGGGFDYHSIATTSAPTQHIFKDSVIKMFSFTLPQGCRNFVRLFRNVPETYTFGTTTVVSPADNPDPCGIFNDFTNSIGNGNVVGGEAFGQTIDNYGWVCNVGLAPLGIKISLINAENKNCEDIIRWNSFEEDNLKVYHVFSSENGIDFKEIQAVSPLGAGSSYEVKNLPTNKYTFYKVVFEDKNGKLTNSNMVKVINGCKEITTVGLFPNPASNELTFILNSNVAIKDNRYTLQILDVLGNIVNEKTVIADKNKFSSIFNISNLPNGNYLLRYQNGNYGNSGIVKFSKLVTN
jgi:hypothetical protein